MPQPALNTDMGAAHERRVADVQHQPHGQGDAGRASSRTASSKAPIPIPIPDVNPLQPPLGVMPAIPTKLELMKDTAKLSPIAALGKGVARAAGTADMVEGIGQRSTCSATGGCSRRASSSACAGRGLAFDGLYFVKSVTSTLKSGEFKQTLRADPQRAHLDHAGGAGMTRTVTRCP